MKDCKEGYLMVLANYMSPWNSIAVLYFKGAYDVISVTMATPHVHKKGLLNVSFCKISEKLIR